MEKLPQRLGQRADHRLRRATGCRRRRAGGRREESSALEGRGRVLVRPSGTEPLVRVMVEAPSDSEAAEVCERLAVRSRRGGQRAALSSEIPAHRGFGEPPVAAPIRFFAEVSHVRHRRLRRAPARSGSAPRGAGEARVPRLRQRGDLDDRRRPGRVGARRRQPQRAARGRRRPPRGTAARAAVSLSRARRPPASATRAGPRTAASPRRTPTPTSTPTTASTSCSTASSRTTSSCATT